MQVRTIGLTVALLLADATIASQPAAALTVKEATAVVDLIEVLQPSLGDFAYSEEAADEWFQQDAEGDGLIAQAGFTPESWRRALRETMSGFLASLPDAEVDEMLSGLREGIAALPQLDDEQRQEALQAIDEETANFLQIRSEGQAFSDAVKPMQPRLRRLVVD